MSYVLDIFKGIRFSLIMLYIATFIMRFSAYLSIALISYMVDASPRGFVIAFYSVMEILTVGFFGVWSDTRGRKIVLIISHILTTLGVALFAIVGYFSTGESNDLFLIIAVFFPIMGIMGAGAASKVASTMTMIADESTIENRAQFMGFFDLATLGGFGAGLAAGHILHLVVKLDLFTSFAIAMVLVIISVFMVIFWVDETLEPEQITQAKEEKTSNSEIFTRLFNVIRTNKDLQKLMPVYIPMISLYGLLVAYAKEIVEDELSGFDLTSSFHLIIVIGVIGIFAGASMLVTGKISDRKRVRRPFIIVGLFCLAILIALFRWFPTQGIGSFEGLYNILPITAVLSWGFGAFPPAILAYLTDISKKDTRGTMFGVYSIIFGSGMIFGPIIGSIFADLGTLYWEEVWGIITAVFLLVILSSIGTLFLEERAKEETNLTST